ncbi:MAG: methyltransferase domain-containing protein [Archaeoglobaceae archaeon]
MERIGEDSKAEVLYRFKWNSSIGEHEETYLCKINIWRECNLLPEVVRELLIGRKEGETFSVDFKKGEIFEYSEKKILKLRSSQFDPPASLRARVKPRIGRFYPFGFFRGISGVFPQNIIPVRVIGVSEDDLVIDTNVPIAKYDLHLDAQVLKVSKKVLELGGSCRDWFSIALENGPGMQVRYDGLPTDFEFDNPETFRREDETSDRIFYEKPRITTHIDSKAHENLVELYSRVLPNEGKILDLMSSYQSHIPENEKLEVVGLGLNEEEMRLNKRLKEYVIHDLNENPKLPFDDNEFDAVVCDLSIEYVVKPFELVAEIRRILKKKGVFTASFSNRYFPPKVIKIWTELHEFERMGYVLEILLRDGGYKNFKTFSIRGMDRPIYDKYVGITSTSDPLYVVYAQKA